MSTVRPVVHSFPKTKKPCAKTQLFCGAKMGQLSEVWKAVVVRGVRLDEPEEETRNTALCYASMYGHAEIVKFCLAQGAKVNGGNRDGATALMRAALANQVAALCILLDNGASVKCRDRFGRTALMYAAMNGAGECVETLLRHRASRVEVDEGSMTAYDWAVLRGRDARLSALLAPPPSKLALLLGKFRSSSRLSEPATPATTSTSASSHRTPVLESVSGCALGRPPCILPPPKDCIAPIVVSPAVTASCTECHPSSRPSPTSSVSLADGFGSDSSDAAPPLPVSAETPDLVLKSKPRMEGRQTAVVTCELDGNAPAFVTNAVVVPQWM